MANLRHVSLLAVFVLLHFRPNCAGSTAPESLTQPEDAAVSERRLETIGSFDNKLYFSENRSMTLSSAESFCKSNAMELLSVNSNDELEYLKRTLTSSIKYWTSGISSRLFKWENGLPVTINLDPYVDGCLVFRNEQLELYPSLPYVGDKLYPLCQLVRASDGTTSSALSAFKDQSAYNSTETKQEEKQTVNVSTTSIDFLGTYNGKLYFSTSTSMSYVDSAKAFCYSNEMSLVTVDTIEELTYLNGIVNNTIAYWTSGFDTNVLHWSNGNTVSVPYYHSSWDVGLAVYNKRLNSVWRTGITTWTLRPLCQVISAT